MRKGYIKYLCMSGIFAALIFVTTAYLHIPSHTGYTHIGDAFIYLAGCLLPTPYAIFAGSAGAMLADCLTGFAIWAPASVLIKGITVLFFSRKHARIIAVQNILALIPAWILCIGGYYIYEALVTQNFIVPLAGIPGYITQCFLSTLLFIIIGLIFDKLHLKEKFYDI